VKELKDLRKIISQNIRNARTSLHITQAKLAVYADISVSHMVDIELCRTWVSDKTLSSIAKALNMEAYELLIPESVVKPACRKEENLSLRRVATLIKSKKSLLRKTLGETMDDLVLEIVQLNEQTSSKSEN
jgi:ribosome-binding protein aMBF1 (putative translation factor)